jgi:hypothetical protein
VLGDLEQPGAKAGGAAVLTEAVKRAQERVLADVVGIVRTDDPRGDAEDDPAMALHEGRTRSGRPSKVRSIRVSSGSMGRRSSSICDLRPVLRPDG